MPALSIIPFMFAVIAIIVSNYLNIIFLVIGFLICQILDEILFKYNSILIGIFYSEDFYCSGCNIDDLLLYYIQ